jgi:hypothetical protein
MFYLFAVVIITFLSASTAEIITLNNLHAVEDICNGYPIVLVIILPLDMDYLATVSNALLSFPDVKAVKYASEDEFINLLLPGTITLFTDFGKENEVYYGSSDKDSLEDFIKFNVGPKSITFNSLSAGRLFRRDMHTVILVNSDNTREIAIESRFESLADARKDEFIFCLAKIEENPLVGQLIQHLGFNTKDLPLMIIVNTLFHWKYVKSNISSYGEIEIFIDQVIGGNIEPYYRSQTLLDISTNSSALQVTSSSFANEIFKSEGSILLYFYKPGDEEHHSVIGELAVKYANLRNITVAEMNYFYNEVAGLNITTKRDLIVYYDALTKSKGANSYIKYEGEITSSALVSYLSDKGYVPSDI